MTRARLLLVLLLLAVFVGAARQRPAEAAPAQQTVTLVNPSFEDPYSSGAAQGWGRWHENSPSKPPECSARYAFQPTWSREANSSIVFNGAISQHIGNQFDTWHAGVMQNVAVTPGTTYRFTFYGTGRASNEQYPAPSNTEVNLGIRAGIDPNGSGLWTDPDIVWGGSASPHMSGGFGNWQQVTVEATATGSQITVFVAADLAGANQCRAHLDVWFDQAEIAVVGPAPQPTSPPPPPQPTSPPPPPQPAATNTPVPEPTEIAQVDPTATLPPTATPTETPPPGGTICVNAFADVNANGQHDADEGAMAGVTFRVANASNELVGQGVSSGPDPVCFERLLPDTYQVAQETPAALEMTTAANVSVTLAEGQVVLVEFGSRIRPDATATSPVDDGVQPAGTPVSGSDGEDDSDSGGILSGGGNTLVIAGLATICLAIVLLGGLVVVLLRMRG